MPKSLIMRLYGCIEGLDYARIKNNFSTKHMERSILEQRNSYVVDLTVYDCKYNAVITCNDGLDSQKYPLKITVFKCHFGCHDYSMSSDEAVIIGRSDNGDYMEALELHWG